MYCENKLHGKTVIWNGDSICQGSSKTGTWADRIAKKNDLKAWKNYGIGGGTVTENVLFGDAERIRHSVSASLELMLEEYPDADYIIFEGGTNDADLLGRITEGEIPALFGAVDPDDYSGEYDRNTFCGALESVFYRATKYWRGKKICYIVAQKMGFVPAKSKNRRAYFEYAMQICRKWGIPYLNLWDGCYLNPMLPHMYDREKDIDENGVCSMYRDGQHLSIAGYDYTADIIDSWLKTL
jgi:lysophospholipase L1-like esterase